MGKSILLATETMLFAPPGFGWGPISSDYIILLSKKPLLAVKRIDCDDVLAANDALKEILEVQGFDHPHVLKYYDAFLESPPPRAPGSSASLFVDPVFYVCLTMEYCDRGDLLEHLFRPPIDSTSASNDLPLPPSSDSSAAGIFGSFLMKSVERDVAESIFSAEDELPRRRFRAEEMVVEFLGQICEALVYLHSNGIIHRDLTPRNIMVSTARCGKGSHSLLSNGSPVIFKVGDFGLVRRWEAARSGGGGGSIRTTKGAAGTVGYLSPETVVRPSSLSDSIGSSIGSETSTSTACDGGDALLGGFNHKVDVFSLGCCLYDLMMLVGKAVRLQRHFFLRNQDQEEEGEGEDTQLIPSGLRVAFVPRRPPIHMELLMHPGDPQDCVTFGKLREEIRGAFGYPRGAAESSPRPLLEDEESDDQESATDEAMHSSWPFFSEFLFQLLFRCLHKHKSERPSAKQLLRRIEKYRVQSLLRTALPADALRIIFTYLGGGKAIRDIVLGAGLVMREWEQFITTDDALWAELYRLRLRDLLGGASALSPAAIVTGLSMSEFVGFSGAAASPVVPWRTLYRRRTILERRCRAPATEAPAEVFVRLTQSGDIDPVSWRRLQLDRHCAAVVGSSSRLLHLSQARACGKTMRKWAAIFACENARCCLSVNPSFEDALVKQTEIDEMLKSRLFASLQGFGSARGSSESSSPVAENRVDSTRTRLFSKVLVISHRIIPRHINGHSPMRPASAASGDRRRRRDPDGPSRRSIRRTSVTPPPKERGILPLDAPVEKTKWQLKIAVENERTGMYVKSVHVSLPSTGAQLRRIVMDRPPFRMYKVGIFQVRFPVVIHFKKKYNLQPLQIMYDLEEESIGVVRAREADAVMARVVRIALSKSLWLPFQFGLSSENVVTLQIGNSFQRRVVTRRKKRRLEERETFRWTCFVRVAKQTDGVARRLLRDSDSPISKVQFLLSRDLGYGRLPVFKPDDSSTPLGRSHWVYSLTRTSREPFEVKIWVSLKCRTTAAQFSHLLRFDDRCKIVQTVHIDA